MRYSETKDFRANYNQAQDKVCLVCESERVLYVDKFMVYECKDCGMMFSF